jgi:DNA-binding NtrC family response regulator
MARVLLLYEASLRREEKGTTLEMADSTARDAPRSAGGCDPALLPAHAGRPRVLVAEDDDDLRLLLCDELRREGLDVVGCASGREAIRQREWIHAMGGDPWSLDVVVTDLRLGEIDGLALLRHVAEAGVDLPVVLISAFACLRTRARAGALGAAAFLDKPVAMETLRRLVHLLARERRRRVVRGGGHASRPRPWRLLDG